ncbi:MAG: DUF4258 domain-containing protein [Candidatus Micrarchaeota archaeon]|nr:DUF4258 domain-containing protein [Candidatus Micrarchaeota archaeon]
MLGMIIAALGSFKYYLFNILLISIPQRLFRGDYEVVFSNHALRRMVERRISWELVKKTVFEGKFERFGDNRIKLSKRFNDGAIICVGVVQNSEIWVVTIERGW